MTDSHHASHCHAHADHHHDHGADQVAAKRTSVAAMLSLACAVHCMAVPVLLLALPNLGNLLTGELEWLMVIVIVGLTVPAVLNAWRAGAHWAIGGFGLGLGLLATSFALGHQHAGIDHAASLLGTGLAIGGSLLLASAHWHTQRRLACC